VPTYLIMNCHLLKLIEQSDQKIIMFPKRLDLKTEHSRKQTKKQKKVQSKRIEGNRTN